MAYAHETALLIAVSMPILVIVFVNLQLALAGGRGTLLLLV